MSWVLPNCGEANSLPAKSLGDLIPESFLTTNTAPPLAAPVLFLDLFHLILHNR